MRRMYSENQLKKIANEAVFTDISNVTITKGSYTTYAYIHVSICGKCITIAGSITINNTSEESIENYSAIKINNLNHGDSIDENYFPMIKDYTTLAPAFFSYDNMIIIKNVPTGETIYEFDVDLIDTDDVTVED